MFQAFEKSSDRNRDYDALARSLFHLLEGETDLYAALANASALLNWFMDEVNWLGFYLWKEGEGQLVLGPFQGLPACVRIPPSRGVCGKVLEIGATRIVQDVHNCPEHIACDSDSRSELVIPVRKEGQIVAVLDMDSTSPGRFDQCDAAGMEGCVAILEKMETLDWGILKKI